MAGRRHKPEEIAAKLRKVELLTDRGQSIAEAVKTIDIAQTTYFRWRAEFSGLTRSQTRRLKELELENARLRLAVSNLTLDKLILRRLFAADAARRLSDGG
jgi:putative transposase